MSNNRVSVALATEAFFSEHNGIVHFDPIFQETKFKIIEGGGSSLCSGVDYNEMTGTLAFTDILGNLSVASIQNVRRIFGMSRKGFTATLITTGSSKSETGSDKYSIDFDDIESLDKIGAKNEKKQKKVEKSIDYERNHGSGWSCVKWNKTFGARSSWLISGSNSGLVRIFDCGSVRQFSTKKGIILPREQFEQYCINSTN
jgi:hypothetical protein